MGVPERKEPAMATWREIAIDAGMGFFRASGAHKLTEPYTRGEGAILTFHHVRPRLERRFEPNRPLEITAEFLCALLEHLRKRGYHIISLDAAIDRLQDGGAGKEPYIVLTFDDGYRDLVEFALPILERCRAPFTAYVTSGFADGSARLWWVELEEAIRRLDHIDVIVGGERFVQTCKSASEKSATFTRLYWLLRSGSEDELLRVAQELCAQADVDSRLLTKNLCLDWAGLRDLARHELATIGTHTVTHARLAKLDSARAKLEMKDGCAAVERELGVPARHFSYPVGDPTSAGRREFEFAAQLGFTTAVTTRPGMIFPELRVRLHALPRLSINGRHQSLESVDILLSGLPFVLMNRGRRVVPA
jgi:peptidoglycan/xylan/chitin deacetylase (PgdA/CDA1 family)